MRALKHVKFFENFMLNENLRDDLYHIIEYKGLHPDDGDRLFAGQNSNFQQNLTKDGRIIGGSDLKRAGVRYLIGRGDILVCHNSGNWKFEDKDEFLSLFNNIHKTDYKKVHLLSQYD
jgi:hypothetical protein